MEPPDTKYRRGRGPACDPGDSIDNPPTDDGAKPSDFVSEGVTSPGSMVDWALAQPFPPAKIDLSVTPRLSAALRDRRALGYGVVDHQAKQRQELQRLASARPPRGEFNWLLFKELLSRIGFEDAKVADEGVEPGLTLHGVLPSTGLWPARGIDPPSVQAQKDRLKRIFKRAANRRARGDYPLDSRHTKAIWDVLTEEERQGWWDPPRRPDTIEKTIGQCAQWLIFMVDEGWKVVYGRRQAKLVTVHRT